MICFQPPLVGLVIGRFGAMIHGGSYPWLHPGLIPLVRGRGRSGLGIARRVGVVGLEVSSPCHRPSHDLIADLVRIGWLESGCVFRSSCEGQARGGWAVPIGLIRRSTLRHGRMGSVSNTRPISGSSRPRGGSRDPVGDRTVASCPEPRCRLVVRRRVGTGLRGRWSPLFTRATDKKARRVS